MIAYTIYDQDPRVKREADYLSRSGYSVDVIALEGNHNQQFFNNVNLHFIPLHKKRTGVYKYILDYSLFFLYAFIKGSLLCLRKRYQIIHIHNMPNFIVFTAILPKIMGAKIILDVHDPMSVVFSTMISAKKARYIRKLIELEEKMSYGFPDRLITVNVDMKQYLINSGCKQNKIDIIHNYPDLELFKKKETKKINNKKFTLIYAGSVLRRNHLDTIIEGIRRVRSEIPDLEFRIMGDGPDVKQLKQLTKNYLLDEKIFFVGQKPIWQIPDLLSEGDLAVASYGNNDLGNLAFPTKVLEALILGVPVLCSRTKMVEKYFSYDCLFYFEPECPDSVAEQLLLINQNPSLLEDKIEQCGEIMKTMNWEEEQKKLLEIYHNLSSRRVSKL